MKGSKADSIERESLLDCAYVDINAITFFDMYEFLNTGYRLGAKLLLHRDWVGESPYDIEFLMVRHKKYGYLLPGGRIDKRDFLLYGSVYGYSSDSFYKTSDFASKLMFFTLARELAEEVGIDPLELGLALQNEEQLARFQPYAMLCWENATKQQRAIDFIFARHSIFSYLTLEFDGEDNDITGASFVKVKEILSTPETPVNIKYMILRASNQIIEYEGTVRCGDVVLPEVSRSFMKYVGTDETFKEELAYFEERYGSLVK